MSDVRFDDTCFFEENLEAFLVVMESVDAEMTAILRANADSLVAITAGDGVVRRARGEFNQAIAEALDTLITDEEGS